MAGIKVERNDLYQSLGNLKKAEQWLKAAEKLGFPITRPNSGTSHCSIRRKDVPVDEGIKSLVSTVYDGMGKQVNQKVFKKILSFDVAEDDLWEALGML